MLVPTYFASTATEATGPIAALGIDWTLLVFQLIAFSLLVFALNKWVYPIFIRAIDKREAMIEESTKAAVNAEKNAAKSQEETEKLLKQARVEAKEIVVTAKEQAAGMLSDAELKSKQQAERAIANAEDAIAKEVIAAKKALHNETIELIALATEKVVSQKVNASADAALIKRALEEAK
jgi:F-type H+-transporting ATPase subunit b